MKRLFTLGCSYTQNSFPTWAHWLSSCYDEFGNLAQPGLGNRAIFNRLSELVYKSKLTKDDTVVIAWSTPVREDRWYADKGGWVGLGNIYNQGFYPDDWVKKYFDPFMGLMETINYAHAALHVLDNVGCNYAITWMMKPDDVSSSVEINDAASFINSCDPKNKLGDYLNYVLSHKNMIDIDIHNFVTNFDEKNAVNDIYISHNNGPYFKDIHPKPISVYYYVKEILCPKLQINNFDETGSMLELANQWMSFLKDYPRENRNQPQWPTKFNRGGFDCF